MSDPLQRAKNYYMGWQSAAADLAPDDSMKKDADYGQGRIAGIIARKTARTQAGKRAGIDVDDKLFSLRLNLAIKEQDEFYTTPVGREIAALLELRQKADTDGNDREWGRINSQINQLFESV